jgi:hypothetical protein
MGGLREAARTSELHRPLEPVLLSVSKRIQEIVLKDPPRPPRTPPPTAGRIRIDDIELDGIDTTLNTLRGQIEAALSENSGKKARIEWWLE